MLQEGQKYRLSLDYTASSTASINYHMQANHDSYTPYLNGSASANGTTQTFEKEFTAGMTDFDCIIVLAFKGSGTLVAGCIGFLFDVAGTYAVSRLFELYRKMTGGLWWLSCHFYGIMRDSCFLIWNVV